MDQVLLRKEFNNASLGFKEQVGVKLMLDYRLVNRYQNTDKYVDMIFVIDSVRLINGVWEHCEDYVTHNYKHKTIDEVICIYKWNNQYFANVWIPLSTL